MTFDYTAFAATFGVVITVYLVAWGCSVVFSLFNEVPDHSV